MSCITVLVGQCGNQLGTAFLSSVAEEALDSANESYQQAVSSQFFRSAADVRGTPSLPLARCVLVDMESKAIAECSAAIRRGGKYTLSDKQCVTREEGSANNWAFGYNAQGPSRLDSVVESLRKEAEASCTVASFHVVHGIAGGTGSGVGCLLADAIRTEYPHALLTHSIVWPFAHGEVTTQWYNTLLALQHLQAHADSIFALSNDDVAQLLRRASGGGGSRAGSQQPSFGEINHVMSGYLSALYLPRMLMEVPEAAAAEKRSRLLARPQQSTSSAIIRPAAVSDVVEAVALDPRRKVFQCEAVPLLRADQPTHLRSNSWQSILPEALRVVHRMAAESSLLVLRGTKATTEGNDELRGALAGTTTGFTRTSIAALHASSVPFRGQQAFAGVYSNTNAFAAKLEYCLAKVETMVEAGAFVHHFDRYGVGQREFEDATLSGWQVAASYGSDIHRVC